MYGMSDSIELDTGLDTDLTDATFVVVDTETTGVSADRDRLIEIAAVKVRGGEIIERFTQLIDPERAVPQRITRITGITTAMVFGKPRAADVLPAFCERSEEHTSELQSRGHLVCRLLLEKQNG